MTRTRRRLLLLAVVAASAGGWIAGHHAGGRPGAITSVAPDVLSLGRLRLMPCSIGRTDAGVATARAYCTDFAVPEDRSRPAGRTIRLKVAIVPAESAEVARDLVVFLDGGPGGAATDDYPAIAAAFAPLRRQHALLLVDQRGTGGSNPLDCEAEKSTATATPAAPPAAAPGGSPAGTQPAAAPPPHEEQQAALARLRECVAQLAPRAAPQFYGTSDAVADLEDLRRALGSPPLDVIGVSYGTRVAQQYAKAWPQSVRALVLDSAVPNDLALGSEHARNLENVLQALFARCRAQRDCTDRYGDPYRTLRTLQGRLRAQPVQLPLRDPYTFRMRERRVTADSLAQLVRLYAYNPHTAALLPYVLAEAAGGDFAPLMGQAQVVVEDVDDSMNGGMALSVVCAEDADRLHPNAADQDTVLGNSLIEHLGSACPAWPHGTRPPGFGAPLRGAVPTLVLAGERDPVTPPRYGRQIVASLPRGRLLLLAGQGHGLIGVGCMPRLLADFVRTLDARGLDARCLDALGPSPAFLDANGSAP